MKEMELRKAENIDSRELWEWRNDDLTRLNSRNKNKISWKSHVEWFKEALNNPSKAIYIGIVNGEKIGRLSFDKLNNEIAEIGVIIAPKGRGYGFGSKIISRGSEKYFAEESGVTDILAEIKRDNITSIKVFEKAGYNLRENYQRYKDGRDVKYYYYFLKRI